MAKNSSMKKTGQSESRVKAFSRIKKGGTNVGPSSPKPQVEPVGQAPKPDDSSKKE